MSTRYTIGFSNLSDASPFSHTVQDSLLKAAQAYPDVDLICRDNALNDDCALANAEFFVEKQVDAAIIYHINQRFGMKIRTALKGTPTIAVDIPIGFTPYFGVNNRQSGELLGEVLGRWIKSHWQGQVEKVLVIVDARVLDAVRERVTYTIDALPNYSDFDKSRLLYINYEQDEPTYGMIKQVFERWNEHSRIAVIGYNADTTRLALDAIDELGRHDDVIVVGHGADGFILDMLKDPGTRLLASTEYHPENYGSQLLRTALNLLRTHGHPAFTYIDIDRHIAKRWSGEF